MFGLLRRPRSPGCALGANLLAAVVLCALLLRDNGECVTMLEVEPRVVLIHSPEQQEERQQDQDQQSANVSSPSSAVVREALFSCLEVESRRRPQTEVVWIKDGEIIVTKGNRKYRNFGKKKRLLISDPQAEDSGIYECAISPNSTEKGRAELWIVPQVLSAPSPQTLLASADEGVIKCQVSLGTQLIEWWLEDRRLATLNLTTTGGGEVDGHTAQQDSRYSILHNGSLILSSVSGVDEGLYRCVASNKAGKHFKEIKVTINGSDDIKEEELHGETTPTSPYTDDNLTENSSQRIRDCVEYEDITFGPNPVLPTLPTPTAKSSNSVMSHTQPQQPYFTALPPPCVQSLMGYRIVLNCTAGGSPRPNITWVKDGKELLLPHVEVLESRTTYQPHYVQMADGSLLINPVQFEDRGKYVCQSSNGEGPGAEISAEVRLRVTKMEEVCGRQSQGVVSGSGSGHIDVGGEEDHRRRRRRRRRKRVAYGEVVTGAHEWPWQALIEYKENESLCGGTLIRPDWVVTAAHCLYSSQQGWVSEGDLTVRMGVFNRSTIEYHQQQLQVRNYFVHPNYIPREFTSSKEHDIALLKLLHPVKLTAHVGPVCLPPEYNDPPAGTLCTVTGWGHLEHEGSSPELLHKAQVPLVSYSTCRNPQSYGRSTSTVTRNMLCAGWTEGGPDACQNDSGGPLVCSISSESPEQWALYGVVNWGYKCGLPHKYGVYARVTRYMRWINQKMKLH